MCFRYPMYFIIIIISYHIIFDVMIMITSQLSNFSNFLQGKTSTSPSKAGSRSGAVPGWSATMGGSTALGGASRCCTRSSCWTPGAGGTVGCGDPKQLSSEYHGDIMEDKQLCCLDGCHWLEFMKATSTKSGFTK